MRFQTETLPELSPANGQALHDGDQDIRVESISEGFKTVLLEYVATFTALPTTPRQTPDDAPKAASVDGLFRGNRGMVAFGLNKGPPLPDERSYDF